MTIDKVLAAEHPGRYIADQCERLGVTVHEVAKEARIAPSTVYRWLDGRTTPGWYAFARVERVLRDFWSTREERNAG